MVRRRARANAAPSSEAARSALRGEALEHATEFLLVKAVNPKEGLSRRCPATKYGLAKWTEPLPPFVRLEGVQESGDHPIALIGKTDSTVIRHDCV